MSLVEPKRLIVWIWLAIRFTQLEQCYNQLIYQVQGISRHLKNNAIQSFNFSSTWIGSALCIYVSFLHSDLIPVMTLAMTTTASAITTPLLALIVATCTIARNINIVIPIISHKIDWLATGAIPLTVLAPVFSVAWRHAQINRLRCHTHWHWLDHDRCWVN